MRTTGAVAHRRRPPPTPAGRVLGRHRTIPPAQNVLTVKVLNRTNGQYPDSQVFWSFNGQTHSIAEQPYLDMPANSAGRMYFYLGTPNGQYIDFIEFTVGPTVFNGNTTRVDAFGLKLAMRLHAARRLRRAVGEDQATFAEDRAVTFQRFINEVPAEFERAGADPGAVPDLAPGSDPSFRAGGVNANYFTAYAASVGVNAATSDIFGCAGQPGRRPDQCAALNRHVAQLPPAQWSDPDACTTWPRRPTTTPSSGTTTPSTSWRTASRTTTSPASRRSSRTATRSGCWSPSAGNRHGLSCSSGPAGRVHSGGGRRVRARAEKITRSRALRVRAAARSNSARASVRRPSRASRSPRTAARYG